MILKRVLFWLASNSIVAMIQFVENNLVEISKQKANRIVPLSVLGYSRAFLQVLWSSLSGGRLAGTLASNQYLIVLESQKRKGREVQSYAFADTWFVTGSYEITLSDHIKLEGPGYLNIKINSRGNNIIVASHRFSNRKTPLEPLGRSARNLRRSQTWL